MVNVVSGLVFMLIAGVFWVQRDYTSEFGGLFPDPIIILLAAFGLLLAVLGLVKRRPVEQAERVPLSGLARAALLLIAWIAALPLLGYVLSSVVFFLLTALLMRHHRPDLKGILLDLGISVGVVAVLYLLFTEVLVVQLPELAL